MVDSSSKTTAHSISDKPCFASLSAIEDRHFWFRARNLVIATLVSQIAADMAPGFRVLEAGCGTGNVLGLLERICSRGVVIGMDLFSEGLYYARKRTSCHLVQGDVNAPPFVKGFDLICLFDVLEHLQDDVQVLSDLHGMLSRNGILLLTVPAHPSLWSYFDEASHHFRRYELGELEKKLVGTGHSVEYITPYMGSILPLVWLSRKLTSLNRRQTAPDLDGAMALAAAELRIIPVVNFLLALVLSQEARLIAHRWRLPLGTSLLAVARKN